MVGGGHSLCDTDYVRDSEYACGRKDAGLTCACGRWERGDGLFVGGVEVAAWVTGTGGEAEGPWDV